MPVPNASSNNSSPWGAAAKFRFDDPTQWHTVSSVPLLDEHELTSDNGKPIATVDRSALEEIARNNNRKVFETGDPATLILGHTSDDPRASEKPAQGFVVNYQVKPFKRDESGRVIYAIHGDYKLRPNKKHLVEEYPRRSVELWWNKRDIDPVAMLGGSSPERDLGAVIRNGRLNHVALQHNSKLHNTRESVRDLGLNPPDDVIRFHRHGNYVIEDYAIATPKPKYKYGKNGKVEKCLPNGKMKYAEDAPDYEDASDISFPGERVQPNQQENYRKMLEERERQRALDQDEARNKKVGKRKKYAGDEDTNTEDTDEEQYSPEDRARMRKPEQQRDSDTSRRREQSESDQQTLEGRRDRRKLPPGSGGSGMGPRQYDDMGNDGLDTHDPGDEGIPTDDQDLGGDDWHGTNDADAGDDAQMSPAVREVLQSKQFKDMQSKLDQLFDMLMGGGEQGGMGGGGMDAPGGDAPMGEMPAPGGGGMGGGMPVDAPGGDAPMGGGAGGPPPPTEEDSRRGMGQRPVQMSQSGFPGQGNVSIPNMNGKKVPSKLSRRGGSMNAARRGTGNDRTALLEREVVELRRYQRESRLRYSQAEAARRVEALASEGYLFGNTPTEHVQGVEETKNYFSALLFNAPSESDGVADVEHEEKIIRARYQRRRADPVRSGQVGLSRFSRDPNQTRQAAADPIGADGENFEPSDTEAAEFADLVTGTNTPGRKKYSRREAAEILIRRRRQ